MLEFFNKGGMMEQVGILFLCLAVIIAYIALGFLMATLTIKIQKAKGYKTIFSVGFFFGPFAWLYYAAMPDLEMRKLLKEKENSEKKD